MILQKVKPYQGIEVAGYGEEFEIRREISVDRKYNENDGTTYNVYHVRELKIVEYQDSVILI